MKQALRGKNEAIASTQTNGSVDLLLTDSRQTQALVAKEIHIEKLQAIGGGQTPLIVYTTSKGRCSTFLSKAKFVKCLQCFLQIKQQNFGKITGYEISNSGVAINTDVGKYFVVDAELKAFLERYNRVGLEGLEVELTGISAVVRNPIKGTVSEINKLGCNCGDSFYRQIICKHQIASQLHLNKLGWGSLAEYLSEHEGKKWEDKFLAIALVAKADLGL